MQVKTLILGAGLTGLSAAYHLEQAGETDYLLVEKEAAPGGLCASVQKNGFTYDYGGHLLHLHTPYGKKLVKKLLQNNCARLHRNAWIYTASSRVPYPFQAHLSALPAKQRAQCVAGFNNRPAFKNIRTFEQWCLAQFGRGVYEQFFKPYNTKLWGLSPSRLTAQWCGPFVPVLSAKELRQSLQKRPRKTYGYNSSFYYPQKGGIGALAQALADKISRLQLRSPVTAVDLTRKIAVVKGKEIHYKHLINTLPLDRFIGLLKNQKILKKQAKKLKSASVTLLHLAVARPVEPFSWIYFPEKTVPFYRVGLQSGFSPTNAPKGTSLFYIELPGLQKPSAALKKKIWNSLLQKGIINRSDRAVFSAWQHIPAAYAVYDKNREKTVEALRTRLRRQGCRCAGRYGRWEYTFMESALLEGKDVASQVKK